MSGARGRRGRAELNVAAIDAESRKCTQTGGRPGEMPLHRMFRISPDEQATELVIQARVPVVNVLEWVSERRAIIEAGETAAGAIDRLGDDDAWPGDAPLRFGDDKVLDVEGAGAGSGQSGIAEGLLAGLRVVAEHPVCRAEAELGGLDLEWGVEGGVAEGCPPEAALELDG